MDCVQLIVNIAGIIVGAIGTGVAISGVLVAKKALSAWKDTKMFEKTEEVVHLCFDIGGLTETLDYISPGSSGALQDKAIECTNSLSRVLTVLTIYITSSSLDKISKELFSDKVRKLIKVLVNNPIDDISLMNANNQELYYQLNKSLVDIYKASKEFMDFVVGDLPNIK